jgi:uncharacterized protein (TIGR02118 family)
LIAAMRANITCKEDTEMLKLDILVVRRADMTRRQFVEYWRDRHGPFFASQPIVKKTVRRYVQSRTMTDTPAGLSVGPYDGIAQIWFDDVSGFLEYLHSSNYTGIIRPDEERITDPHKVQFLFSEETPIIG